MNEENKEVIDSSTDTANNEAEIIIDDVSNTETQTEPTEREKKLFARAKKAEAELKALKTSQKQVITEEKPKTYGIEDEVLDLRLEGYSKQEVEFVMKNGGRKALEDKNSYVAVALNTIREQKRAEQAASQTSNASGLSEVERKYTTEQLKNMSVKELEKILPHA